MIVQDGDDNTSGYTEYGYRGLEELKQKDLLIEKLKKEIEELKAERDSRIR
tara:strand:- start:646 stop:798 length:153 start_codon:yes stop_codon:yes gene_type:complete